MEISCKFLFFLQKATKADAAKSTAASSGSKVEPSPVNVDTILLEIKCAGDEVRKLKACKADKVGWGVCFVGVTFECCGEQNSN